MPWFRGEVVGYDRATNTITIYSEHEGGLLTLTPMTGADDLFDALDKELPRGYDPGEPQT